MGMYIRHSVFVHALSQWAFELVIPKVVVPCGLFLGIVAFIHFHKFKEGRTIFAVSQFKPGVCLVGIFLYIC